MRVSLRRTALALVLTHKATQAPALDAARKFADTLFSILLTAGAGVNPDRAAERRIAMWSIGWLTSIPGRLMDRVVTHIATPLIPTEMGSIFESSIVRTSACWALATHGRKPRLASVSAVDARIQNIIVAMREEPEFTVAGPTLMPSSPEIGAYAHQAEKYVHGRPLVRHEAPVVFLRFSI